jgi:hypothetical protein
MLDHVERRRIAEQPAREHLAPGQRIARPGAFLDEDLHEGARFLRLFPRQGALAGCQPDDDIAHPPRFAGFQNDVLRQVVALVEQAERGDAFGNWRAIAAFDRRRADRRLANRARHISREGLRLVVALPRTGRQQAGRHQEKRRAHGRFQEPGDFA